MHTRWLGPRCISTGSVSEQTRGPDLLPTIPGTEAAVLDGEASPDLSKADRGRTRCQAVCHGCAGPAGMLGGLLGSLAAGLGCGAEPGCGASPAGCSDTALPVFARLSTEAASLAALAGVT